MNQNEYTQVILGIPLAARDTPPSDAVDCIPLPCEECNGLLWISGKKRKIKALNSSIPIICFNCLVNMMGYYKGAPCVNLADVEI